MLILEAKVRAGLKPVVFLDERASVEEVVGALVNLFQTVYDMIERKHFCDATKFLDGITSALDIK